MVPGEYVQYTLCARMHEHSHTDTHTHPHTQENSGQYGQSGLDLNVEPAWMQGATGHGVVVAVVDDGQSTLVLVFKCLHYGSLHRYGVATQ